MHRRTQRHLSQTRKDRKKCKLVEERDDSWTSFAWKLVLIVRQISIHFPTPSSCTCPDNQCLLQNSTWCGSRKWVRSDDDSRLSGDSYHSMPAMLRNDRQDVGFNGAKRRIDTRFSPARVLVKSDHGKTPNSLRTFWRMSWLKSRPAIRVKPSRCQSDGLNTRHTIKIR